ncbi:MAG: PIN domain-containing protein [Candidatus Aenigmarchaeota archaeon]|nr:PIN domain-containing protein [Candidatus Aenigmarchaeota archaeon]
MYCLDTSIIIAIFRGDKELAKKISGLDPNSIFFTPVTLCELFKGAYKSQQKEKSLALIYDFSVNYRLLGSSARGCELFGKDFNILEKAGKPTQEFDLMMASIAKENGLVLVTRNRKHFENVQDLKLEVW